MSDLTKELFRPLYLQIIIFNFDVAQCALQQVIATKSPTSPHSLSQQTFVPSPHFTIAFQTSARFHTSCHTIYLTHTICCQQFQRLKKTTLKLHYL